MSRKRLNGKKKISLKRPNSMDHCKKNRYGELRCIFFTSVDSFDRFEHGKKIGINIKIINRW